MTLTWDCPLCGGVFVGTVVEALVAFTNSHPTLSWSVRETGEGAVLVPELRPAADAVRGAA